jgi:hypothetical protein
MSLECLLRLYVSAPDAFWRHDVDLSLEAAVKMARFAQMAGVKCTFAIMARNEFYNPFSFAGRDALAAISGAGHRLIPHVHYLPGVHGGNPGAAVYPEVALWRTAYDHLVDTNLVSFHMPPRRVIWKDFDGFLHCHSSEWEGRYVSDSRREWTAQKEARVANDMQIALHPEHWFLPDHKDGCAV